MRLYGAEKCGVGQRLLCLCALLVETVTRGHLYSVLNMLRSVSVKVWHEKFCRFFHFVLQECKNEKRHNKRHFFFYRLLKLLHARCSSNILEEILLHGGVLVFAAVL